MLTGRELNKKAQIPRTKIGQNSRIDRGKIDTNFSPGRTHQRRMRLIIQR